MWGDHYETLLNCVKSDECKDKIIDFISSDSNIKNVFIQPCQVKDALQSTKLGKACGHDGLAAEHFIFADGSICVYLSMLYSSMLSHGYLPEEFIKSCTYLGLKTRLETQMIKVITDLSPLYRLAQNFLNVQCLASLKSTCARVTTNLGLRVY